MQNTFYPSRDTLDGVCASLSERLDLSLRHMLCEARPADARTPQLEKLVTRLMSEGDYAPNCGLFAWNRLLMDAALANATDRFERLIDAPPEAPEARAPRVREFSADQLGAASHSYLSEVFKDDSDLTTDLVPPEFVERAAFDEALPHVRDLLSQHAPDWSAELDVLAADILLGVNQNREKSGFAGASVFDAFGAVLVNPIRQTDPAELFMTLIHESSHSRLFLFHLDDPILLNDGEARYTSPLRKTPRPIEGIFHAFWVSARMSAAAGDTLKTYQGPFADKLRTLAASADSVAVDCQTVLDAEADFTSLGQTVYQDAVRALRDE